ncbi:MAG: ankyrin repeat domain-containing protein, partial [Candidatus Jidaibacter sp.]|nr:ankyrin repeat domain-containing protein [Candidatus Jidaibacter sp.]
ELLLADKDIEVNAADVYRHTALMYAAKARKIQVVELLLDHDGIDINAADTGGNTALSNAARAEHAEVVSALCDHGADLTVSPSIFENQEIREILEGYQRFCKFNKYRSYIFLVPSSPSALMCLISGNPLHHATLGVITAVAAFWWNDSIAYDELKVSSMYSASTALLHLGDSVSDDYILPCKIMAYGMIIAAAIHHHSLYSSNIYRPTQDVNSQENGI